MPVKWLLLQPGSLTLNMFQRDSVHVLQGHTALGIISHQEWRHSGLVACFSPPLEQGTGLQTGQEDSTPASPSSWPAEGESGYLGLSRELSAAPKELQALILSPSIFSRLLL